MNIEGLHKVTTARQKDICNYAIHDRSGNLQNLELNGHVRYPDGIYFYSTEVRRITEGF